MMSTIENNSNQMTQNTDNNKKYENTGKLLTKKNILSAVILALVIIVCTAWFAGGISGIASWKGHRGFHDWDEKEGFHRSVQKSLTAGQFPLWNPYINGGVPLWADSQVSLTPLDAFMIILGPNKGIKTLIFTIPLIAGICMFFLLRDQRNTIFASYIGALLFALGGPIIVRLWDGHHNMIPLAWFPLLLLFFDRSLKTKSIYIIPAAIVIDIMIFSGGNYIVIFSGLFLGIYSIALALQEGTIKPLIKAILTIVLCAALGAIKILPALEFAEFADIQKTVPHIAPPLSHILGGFVTKFDTNIIANCTVGARGCLHEHAAYIGWIPILFFGCITIIRLLKKQNKKNYSNRIIALIITALAFILISRGDNLTMRNVFGTLQAIKFESIWSMLTKLPILGSQDVSVRYLIIITPIFLVLLAEAITYTEHAFHRNKHNYLGNQISNGVKLLLLLLLLIDLRSASDYFFNPFTLPVVDGTPAAEFRQRHIRPIDIDYELFHAEDEGRTVVAASVYNFGAANNNNPTATIPIIVTTDDEPDYKGEQYLVGDNDGTVNLTKWTPNQLEYDVNVTQDNATLVINQNYFPGWKSTSFGHAFSYNESSPITSKHDGLDGLIGLNIPQGEHHIVLKYQPKSFYYGLTISFLTLICIGLIARIERKRNKKKALIATA